VTAVIGVDSSTQSCKVLAVDAETGDILSAGSAPHPEGTAIDPGIWTAALQKAWHDAGIPALAAGPGGAGAVAGAVVGVGIAAQQHGMVALDEHNRPVHDALLWNDIRSAAAANEMRDELGAEAWVDATNIVPVASFTLTKLAWLARHEPALAERVGRVVLPHDWLNFQLSGVFTTDRSDASGTGYFDPVGNRYRPELLERFFGRVPDLPPVLGPSEQAGPVLERWGLPGAMLSAGAGDNAAAALGLALKPGEIAVSVGTSGTVFTTSSIPTRDTTGAIAGFADATGNHLPLLAMLNSARVLRATADMLAVDLATFDSLALNADPAAAGLTFMPYLDGERTPNLPDAHGALLGLSRANMSAGNVARASVLGVLNSLADAIGLLASRGVQVERVLLIGGGSKSRALRRAAAAVFGVPVEIPVAREYVALGAARQAAWAATGELPDWKRHIEESFEPSEGWGSEVRGRYIEARKALYGV
jgi:xylulokinase